MTSNMIIPRMLNLRSSKPNLVKGILGPLSRGHHQIRATTDAAPRSNSQTGALAPSGSFFIKPGLVSCPQRCFSFTCDILRTRTFSSIAGNTKCGKISSSQAMYRISLPFACDVSPKTCMFCSIPAEPQGNKMHKKQFLEYLLSKPPKDQDAQRIKEALKEFEEMEFDYDKNIYISLIQFFCNQNDLTKTMHYKRRLQAEFPAFQIYEDVLVDLATLMATRAQYDEAENLLYDVSAKHTIEVDKNMFHRVTKLLIAIESSGDIECARRVLDLLITNGFYSGTPPNTHLGILINIHLKKKDIESALEEFMEIFNKYQATPSLRFIFQALIIRSESDKLKKVMDVASQRHGEWHALFVLAQAFLRLNYFKEVVDIFQNSDLALTARKLNELLQHIVDGRKIQVLEELMKVRPDLFEVNKDLLYYHLIRACVLEENVKKALGLWSIMQKEGIEPSKYTLHLLGSFLTKMGQPVPFSFSKIVGPYSFRDDNRREDRLKGTNLPFDNKVARMSSELENFLNEDRLTDAKKVCDDLVSFNLYPSERILKKYFQKLSDIGDIDAVSALEQQLPAAVVRNCRLYNFQPITKINLGLSEEFMKDLEENPHKHGDFFPGKAFMLLLNKHPEDFQRIKRIANIYHEMQFSFPRNLIWIWLMKNGKFYEAKKIVQGTARFKKTMLFTELREEIKKNKNEALSQALLEQVKLAGQNNFNTGLAYSTHIDLLLSLSKLDEALSTFEESQKFLKLSDLQRSTLESLESELISKKLPVSFSLPEVDESKRSYSSSGDRSRR